jgi:hypothetical protein
VSVTAIISFCWWGETHGLWVVAGEMTSLAGEDLLDSNCGAPPFMLWEFLDLAQRSTLA